MFSGVSRVVGEIFRARAPARPFWNPNSAVLGTGGQPEWRPDHLHAPGPTSPHLRTNHLSPCVGRSTGSDRLTRFRGLIQKRVGAFVDSDRVPQTHEWRVFCVRGASRAESCMSGGLVWTRRLGTWARILGEVARVRPSTREKRKLNSGDDAEGGISNCAGGKMRTKLTSTMAH